MIGTFLPGVYEVEKSILRPNVDVTINRREEKMNVLHGKRILMIIASKGYRDEELNVPKKMFEEAGAIVDVAADKPGKARGMLGSRIESNFLYNEAIIDSYDAVIFVGGVGAKIYWNDPKAHSLAKETVEKDKLLGAICLAPATLANAGVLKNKTATSYTMASQALKKAGANYTGKSVEVDGAIITGEGPRAAEEFASAIIDQLTSHAVAH
jgi:protease I